MVKKCVRCEQEKQDIDFNKDKRYKDGLFCYCKQCQTEKRLQLRRDNFEREISKDLQKAYGITYEDKLAMIKNQGFKCGICKTELSYDNKAAVDHCHTSGKVRGILCRACNTGIGQLQDSVEILQAAIQYLEQH